MPRIILLVVLLAATPAWANMPDAPPLHPSPAFRPVGPRAARGAAVWLHGSYDTDEFPNSLPEPAWIARLAARGYDIWRFDRTPGNDPLAPGEAALARGLAGLKADGYRHIVVAGDSRGAFIGLSALAQTGMVDAMAAISPAAHGTNPARRPQAMADFSALLQAARPMRFALAQFRDDPFDPDPGGRVAIARAVASRAGLALLVIDRPPAPTGHAGGYDPAFDALFGACLTDFLDDGRTSTCPESVRATHSGTASR